MSDINLPTSLTVNILPFFFFFEQLMFMRIQQPLHVNRLEIGLFKPLHTMMAPGENIESCMK